MSPTVEALVQEVLARMGPGAQDLLLHAWMDRAALWASIMLREALTPDAVRQAMLGPTPARITRLARDDKELIVAQCAAAFRAILTAALADPE